MQLGTGTVFGAYATGDRHQFYVHLSISVVICRIMSNLRFAKKTAAVVRQLETGACPQLHTVTLINQNHDRAGFGSYKRH